MNKKPYKCVYCGRKFKEPVPHNCKGGFRKHNLAFEYAPSKEERRQLKDVLDSLVGKMAEARTASPLDTQVGGDHYKKYKIQPIEFIQANGLDFIQGNIVKLATRFRDKGGKQDLEKIIHYAQILIQTEYPDTNE